MSRPLLVATGICVWLPLAACHGALPASGSSPVAAGTSERATAVFAYRPPAGGPAVRSISVRGTFNDWSEHALRMSPLPDGSWRAEESIEPGTHQYKFFINGEWPEDMCHDEVWGDPLHDLWIDTDAEGCTSDGQRGRNAVREIADPAPVAGSGFLHDPALAAHVSAADGRLSIRFRVNRGVVRSASVIVDGVRVPMQPQLEHRSFEIWRATVPETATMYRLELETADGTMERGPYLVPVDVFRSIPWVGGAVGYQIFPERFRNGDRDNDALAIASSARNHTHPEHWHAADAPRLMSRWDGEVMDFHCCHQYFGGDLQGILDQLHHLETLGVSLLYLNPITIAGSAHGYDTFDHLKVAPGLGDERMLRTLLDSAHALGMRVLWDFVPNHVGVGHWAFQHAVTHGESSPWWSWFRFRVPASRLEVGNGAHYGAWSGFGSLPELETRNPEVLDYLMSVTRYWTELGFDGIRVDVPNDIANRREFFTAFRRAAKEVDPEAYLVGEIWGRSPTWLRGDEFDALMNYAIGRDVVQRFAAGEMTADHAALAMVRLYSEYPEASTAMSFNLISSHDTPRLLTSMGGGELGDVPDSISLLRHRLASALLFALPGVPVTFQGDECAFLGGGPPREENRYPMQWESCDGAMLVHYQRLAESKRRLPMLRSSVIRLPRGSGSLLSFLRGEPGEDELLLLFNGSAEGHSFALPRGSWIDALSGVPEGGGLVEVGPFGWRYLKRR